MKTGYEPDASRGLMIPPTAYSRRSLFDASKSAYGLGKKENPAL